MESGTKFIESIDSEDAYCASCEFNTTDLTWYKTQRIGKPEWLSDGYWLCEFCANTHIPSMVLYYPEQYDQSVAKLAKAVGYSHNLLLTTIKEHYNGPSA